MIFFLETYIDEFFYIHVTFREETIFLNTLAQKTKSVLQKDYFEKHFGELFCFFLLFRALEIFDLQENLHVCYTFNNVYC